MSAVDFFGGVFDYEVDGTATVLSRFVTFAFEDLEEFAHGEDATSITIEAVENVGGGEVLRFLTLERFAEADAEEFFLETGLYKLLFVLLEEEVFGAVEVVLEAVFVEVGGVGV